MKKLLLIVSLLFILPRAYSRPIDDLLDRIGGKGTHKRFVTAVIPADGGGEYFTISSEHGRPKIVGDSHLSIAAGIHWYLKYHAGVFLTWNNLTTDLSATELPLPAQDETHSTSLAYRYYLNYCTYSYSMAFWDWERWEKEIDWMALHGINMPLALTGTEVVWRNVLTKKLGYTKKEADEFIAGPGFQAWFLMNNLEGWGGPNPDRWYAQQEALQKKIVARMRELGIEPVLAGYSGMVPSDIGSKKGWKIADPGKWCSFQRPGFLLPTDPNFNEMAKYYYDEMRELYGTSRYYSMDPFHEGGSVAGVDLDAAFKAVYRAMVSYCGRISTPKWVIQSWQENPRREALNALEPGTLIVLDLFADAQRKWSDWDGFRRSDTGDRHEFAFCVLNNFGGRTGMHGRLEKTITDFFEARERYPLTMKGVGITMEGIENNPVVYELALELAWRTPETGIDEWIGDYARYRYGRFTPESARAWQLLAGGIYACPTGQQGVSESVLCARPSLKGDKVSTWSTTRIYYDPAGVREAARLLLSQSDVLSGANYAYDVVDITRQTLADYAYGLLAEIREAHTDGYAERRNDLIERFLGVIVDQDRLLNTVPDFMLGRWIGSARRLGKTRAQKNLYEKNARLQITTWGPEASANAGGLHDYSNREWGGLLKDFYLMRWTAYFDALKSGRPAPNAAAFFEMEYQWASTPTTRAPYPAIPQGDPIQTAKEIFEKYFK